jgi:hypothetical protein
MDLTADAIAKIENLSSQPDVITIDGREHLAIPAGWTVKEGILAPASLSAITLQAVVDYLTQVAVPDAAPSLVVHVAAHNEVGILSVLDGAKRRARFLVASGGAPPSDLLPLKTWLSPDKMILGLLVVMEATKGRDDLIAMLSTLKDGRVLEANDDGIGQSITVSTGVTLVGSASLRAGIVLKPRWTFGEIEQPDVNFVIRAKSGEGESLPSFSLTLADVTWQAATILKIRDWLRAKLPEGTVILA